MQRTRPPFRADHVGSLLRPAALKEAREKRARGEITADALKQVEDREIDNVIRHQEVVGLHSVTDGEFRRVSWNYDFLEQLENVESYAGERKIKFTSGGPQPRPILLRVIGKLGGYKPHPMIEHFKYLKAHTRQTAKVTIPSPSSLHFRYGRDVVPE
ncbi:MAG: 5-methyltetrahydropteroyltriglutamate--homocysteine S-methyltransferase, partial [Xanthobacteraceae bacterium]